MDYSAAGGVNTVRVSSTATFVPAAVGAASCVGFSNDFGAMGLAAGFFAGAFGVAGFFSAGLAAGALAVGAAFLATVVLAATGFCTGALAAGLASVFALEVALAAGFLAALFLP